MRPSYWAHKYSSICYPLCGEIKSWKISICITLKKNKTDKSWSKQQIGRRQKKNRTQIRPNCHRTSPNIIKIKGDILSPMETCLTIKEWQESTAPTLSHTLPSCKYTELERREQSLHGLSGWAHGWKPMVLNTSILHQFLEYKCISHSKTELESRLKKNSFPHFALPNASTYPLGDGDLEDFLFMVFDVLGDLEELLLLRRRLSLKGKTCHFLKSATEIKDSSNYKAKGYPIHWEHLSKTSLITLSSYCFPDLDSEVCLYHQLSLFFV